jgi:hypothetical protein
MRDHPLLFDANDPAPEGMPLVPAAALAPGPSHQRRDCSRRRNAGMQRRRAGIC